MQKPTAVALRAALASAFLFATTLTPAPAADITAATAVKKDKDNTDKKESDTYGTGDDRVVLIMDKIDADLAKEVIGRLRHLSRKSDEPIEMHINSPGGEINSALAIYDVMNSIKNPIKTVCMGSAASAAALLLTAGSPGLRISYTNCEYMIHQVSGGAAGPTMDMRNSYEQQERLQAIYFRILSERSGWSIEQISDMGASGDFYLTPSQAKQMGFIDEIITPVKTFTAARTPSMPAEICEGKIAQNRKAICANRQAGSTLRMTAK